MRRLNYILTTTGGREEREKVRERGRKTERNERETVRAISMKREAGKAIKIGAMERSNATR